MVVVRLKPLREILNSLKGFKRVFIIGCELGSGRCKNGGLKESKAFGEQLRKHGFEIAGIKSLGGTCILKRVSTFEKSFLKEAENNSKVIVSLACGAGTQLIAENVSIPVLTGVDTCFIGAEILDEKTKKKRFDEYCIACGDCIISETGGICPIARCPKSLTNGPCGGAVNGKCEVDPSIPCIWYIIEDRMKKLGTIEKLKTKSPFKDYRNSIHPGSLTLEDED